MVTFSIHQQRMSPRLGWRAYAMHGPCKPNFGDWTVVSDRHTHSITHIRACIIGLTDATTFDNKYHRRLSRSDQHSI